MKLLAAGLVIFGLIVIFAPEIIAILIGGFFILMGINVFMFIRQVKATQKNQKDYIKFGDYKIYR